MKKHVFGNNQNSEGIVKNEKGKPDIRLTFQEPASYILNRYDYYIICAQKLINYLERAQHTLVSRKKKAVDKDSIAENAEEEAT